MSAIRLQHTRIFSLINHRNARSLASRFNLLPRCVSSLAEQALPREAHPAHQQCQSAPKLCHCLQSKYYSEKLGLHKDDAAARQKVAGSFIEGLHWVLEYYYRGVASWTWFYPHHYAPMISDMVPIQDFEVAFQLGQPFLPFQQLLGVLPSASFKLLPEPYQVGMEIIIRSVKHTHIC